MKNLAIGCQLSVIARRIFTFIIFTCALNLFSQGFEIPEKPEGVAFEDWLSGSAEPSILAKAASNSKAYCALKDAWTEKHPKAASP